MAYLFILAAVLLLSPFVLRLAASKDKKTKNRIKTYFLSTLVIEFILGFFNWENFSVGRSGFELSFFYPVSLLGLFFALALVQIILLITGKYFNILVLVLNFISSILIFTAMIRLSNILGFQIASLPSIVAVFLVLSGNILGLVWINQDKNLLKKYRLI